jgi:hypothetical protein
MKFKKLKWGQTGCIPQDEYSETICGKRYHIGTRFCRTRTSETGKLDIKLFGSSVYRTTYNSVDEAKKHAQKDFEAWITKTFFEEEPCPS